MSEIILAIDPSLRGTGHAILERTGKKVTCLEYGVIRNPPKLKPSECLAAIYDRLSGIILQHEPQAMAVESVIYVQSYQTAIALGSARGAVLLAAALRGIPIHEYAPTKVKQAVVGTGGARKAQVGFMVRVLLEMRETPPPDAADAIAVGLAHFHAWDAAKHQSAKLPAT